MDDEQQPPRPNRVTNIGGDIHRSGPPAVRAEASEGAQVAEAPAAKPAGRRPRSSTPPAPAAVELDLP